MRFRRNPSFHSVPSPYAPAPVDAPGLSRETAISISELNDATKTLVESSFGRFWVRGDVTDFKQHRSGHWYFCLRDSVAQIQCVVWASDQRGIPAPPDEGMQVLAQVQMTMFAAKGSLQLRITRLEAAGDGLWRKAMQKTIDRLTADGLLAPERKRALPRYPRVVAIVTSTSGAAVRDIIAVAERRRPGLRIVVSGASVQGDSAPQEICAAISRIMKWGRADVLIVGRGGGSREDLWAFNDERVARAVAASRIPVVSAVGHEIDMTVCDMVADVRAATPSAAAETVIPTVSDMMSALVDQRRCLVIGAQRRAESAALDLRTVSRDLKLGASHATARRRSLLESSAGRLNALSPLATLSRGYAVARDANGQTLHSVSQFREGERFSVQVSDGTVSAVVEKISEGDPPRPSVK
jgi:exodeoxyribonuclease VII large subunit